ncbi:unnamed protein product [Linum tenue]|nr:unnamed protein product [Linum tenue]
MLMKFYSLSSGIIWHLLSGCDGQEVDFPFELSDQEKEIVQFGKSSFVLGRSGSGKTTVLVMKLFQREQLHHIALRGYHEQGDAVETDEQNVLKQLFVTVNPRLCHFVKQNISRLKRSTCGWNLSAESCEFDLEEIDETFLSSDFPDSFVDIPPSFFPLVITFKKFLLMLDCTMGFSFFDRFPEARACQPEKRKNSMSLTLQTFIRTKEVNYEKFSSSYWPYMNMKLTNRVEPFLVFTEITSHIKGGLQALEAAGGHLSRDDYLAHSERRLSYLTEQERCRIYDIYLEYEKRKGKNGEFDLADFVSDIHVRLRVEGHNFAEMDFVYIDEIQDLTMKQIAVFKHVCRNYGEGFLFAGDTAQAISKGVEFRFKDIRSLFYKTFTIDSGRFGSTSTNTKREISDVLHLSQNFRTHAGVLKLAQSVIDLIYHFFPNSIDELNPETSHVNGVRPVLLQSVDNRSTFKSMSEVIFAAQKKSVEFGAEQVVLVRNEEVKNDVLDQVGSCALVLTILECKGLEFEDVLLYNFFGSSPIVDQWELLHGYMKALNISSPQDECHSRHFSDEKLKVLFHELKLLYVAITRTRQRLWIFDESWNPMLELWKRKGIVQLQHLDSDFLASMRVPSTPEEWKKRGRKFLRVQNYEMARICFKNAAEPYWEKYCQASELRAIADRLRILNPQISRHHLFEAAELFDSIGKDESAAQCYFELEEYKKAGEIFLAASKLEEAGECFHLARSYEKAAAVYSKCNSYDKCLSACLDGRLFETGYDYIQRWMKDETFDGVEFMRFLESGAVHFRRVEDYKTMMMFVRAFTSKDLMRTFLVDRNELDCLLDLEEEWGNHPEAANIAGQLGLVTVSADHLKIQGKYLEACHAVLRHVLGESLWGERNNGWPIKDFKGKKQLLGQAKTSAEHVSEAYVRFVCEEVAFLSRENSNSLSVLRNHFEYFQRHRSFRNEILCARKIIDALSNDVLVADIVNYTRYGRPSIWCSIGSRGRGELTKLFPTAKKTVVLMFCLDYLGVRELLSGSLARYHVLYPDAPWLNGSVSSRSFQNRKKRVIISSRTFRRAARAYWSSEIRVVGSEVLQRFETVYEYCVRNRLSIYCRSMLLVHMLDISRLFPPKLTDLTRRFVDHYIENVLNVHFLEWHDSRRNDMINSRGKEEFRVPLEDIMHRYLGNSITCRVIAEVTTLALSTKLSRQKLEMLLTSLKKNAADPLHIEQIVGPLEVGIMPEVDEVIAEQCIVWKLQQTVLHMYYDMFAKAEENLSPSCLVYLLDRLLMMALAWNGCFYAPRSSVVEWLMYNRWKNPCSTSIIAEETQPTVDAATGLVSCIVKDLLNNEVLVLECHPAVVLRLVVLVGMLSINTGKSFDLVPHILGKIGIISMLPPEFYNRLSSLWNREEASDGGAEAFSNALHLVGNPLVCVDLKGGGCPKSKPSSAIFLDMKKLCNQKQEILTTLSPRRNKAASSSRRGKE